MGGTAIFVLTLQYLETLSTVGGIVVSYNLQSNRHTFITAS